MGLRLTGLANFYLFQNSIQNRNNDHYKYSEQLSSNKRVNHPSDDPNAAADIIAYDQNLENLDQYSRNIDVASRSLNATDDALNGVKDIVMKAQELNQRAKGLLSADSRVELANEVQQLQQHLLQLANTQINGDYIFSGYKTNVVPYALSNSQPNANPVETFSGNNQQMVVEIGQGVTLPTQVNGQATFQGDGSSATVDIFQTLANLEVALRTNNNNDSDPAGIAAQEANLDLARKQVLAQITTVGAYTNRIDMTKKHLEQQQISFKSYISSLEDADLTDVIYEYQRSATALQATIKSAGGTLNLPSILEFIGR